MLVDSNMQNVCVHFALNISPSGGRVYVILEFGAKTPGEHTNMFKTGVNIRITFGRPNIKL